MSLNFRLIADSTLDLEAWFGLVPAEHWVNSLFYQELGYDCDQLISATQFPFNFVADDDKLKLKLLIERAQHGFAVTDIDLNLRHAQGVLLPAAISMKLVTSQQCSGIRMSIRLIANPARLNNALRQLVHLTSNAISDNHLHSLCHAIKQVSVADNLVLATLSVDGLFSARVQLGDDTNVVAQLQNAAAESLLGAVLGQGLCLWQGNLPQQYCATIFAATVRSFIGVVLKDTLRKPIGVLFATYNADMPEPLQQKALFQLLAGQVSAELQRSDAEQQIRQMNEELEHIVSERTLELEQTLAHLQTTQQRLVQSEKLSSLGSLVAGIAHELNTPIGNALVCTDHLQQDVSLINRLTNEQKLNRSAFDEFVKRSVMSADIILKNLRRASELINSFKKVSVDQCSEALRQFDLANCINDTLLMLTPAFKHHAASIRVNCPDNISLHSYPGALSQVITNIISNAYIHAFAHQHKGLIQLDASMLTTEQVQIIISDNGRGIAAEDLPKIFDPFFTSRLGQGGSGLGLHICYNLICGPLHGAIVVESEPDRGSRFTLTLPRQL